MPRRAGAVKHTPMRIALCLILLTGACAHKPKHSLAPLGLVGDTANAKYAGPAVTPQ